jgi:S-adenosylmethionine:tRNA ribosyltransferase-isomerase
MLVVDRKAGQLTDKRFFDILEYLPAGDVLVLNNTKVFAARIMGKKKVTQGKVDILLLHEYSAPNLWKCLVQPALKEGQEIRHRQDAHKEPERRDCAY